MRIFGIFMRRRSGLGCTGDAGGWGWRVDRGDPIAASLGLESSHILIGFRPDSALAWGRRVDRVDPFAASLGLDSSYD